MPRAAAQGCCHSGFLIKTPHEAMNAGHASRKSSLSHPGMSEKAPSCNGSAGFGTGGMTAGGV